MPFYVIKGDLVNMNVDAIVNAANVSLKMVEGVTRAIFHKAGDEILTDACKKLVLERGRSGFKPGDAIETPSFNLKNCKIIIHAIGPNYINGKTVTDQNCVTIAVRWNNEIDVSLPESYKRNIIRQIDRYRLINTKIDVIGPVYVGLVVSGEIVVNSFYKQNDKLVEKQIKTFVDNLNKKFGQTLHYGDLFGMIDRLDYVSHLEKLNIIPKGSFIEKTSSEDIVVPPNAVYYIDSIEMSYIRDSYI